MKKTIALTFASCKSSCNPVYAVAGSNGGGAASFPSPTAATLWFAYTRSNAASWYSRSGLDADKSQGTLAARIQRTHCTGQGEVDTLPALQRTGPQGEEPL